MFRIFRRKPRTPAQPTPAPVPDDPGAPDQTHRSGETTRLRGRRGGRRYLVRRWAGLASASLVLVVGAVVGGVVLAQPAAAGALGVCDASMTIDAPTKPDAVDPGAAAYTKTSEKYGQAYTVVDGGAVTPGDAYAGAGLKWSTFGLSSCGDAMRQATATMAQSAYLALVAFPVSILGAILQWAMSTAIGNALLDAASPAVTAMHDNVFLRWGPVVVAAVLLGAMFMIARGQGRKAFSRFGWMIGVIVIAAVLASPSGLAAVRVANDVTSNVASCLAFGFTSGCDNAHDSGSMYTSSMQESLAYPIWAGGALGAKANVEIPDKLDFKGHSGTPAIHTDGTITVPKNVIPAVSAGHPTWAETLRWTQTYTAAEMHAMADDSSLQCSLEQAPKFEALTDPSTSSFPTGGTSQICSYKWIVRAAMIGNLYDNEPGVYSTLRGANTDALYASITAIGIWPLVLGIAVVGLMTLFYQLELVILFVASPAFAVAALRNPETGKKWGGQVVSTLVQRVAVGLTLGLVLWMVQIIISGVTAMSAHVITKAVSPILEPTIVSVLTIVAMIAGFAVFGRLRELLHDTAKVEMDPQQYSKVKELGGVAVGAAAGALGAGSGMRLVGAAQGLMRTASARGGASNPLRAATIGHAAGQNAARNARNGAGDRPGAPVPSPNPTPAPSPTPPVGPRPGDAPDAARAWSELEQAPEVQTAREEAVQAAARRWRAAAEAHRVAETHLRQHREGAGASIAAREAQLVAGGVDAFQAAGQARAEHVQQDERLAATMIRRSRDVDAAQAEHQAAQTGPTDLERQLDAAVRAGQDAQAVAGRHALTPQTTALLARYAASIRATRPTPAPADTGPWA